jgi:hypothetical protein
MPYVAGLQVLRHRRRTNHEDGGRLRWLWNVLLRQCAAPGARSKKALTLVVEVIGYYESGQCAPKEIASLPLGIKYQWKDYYSYLSAAPYMGSTLNKKCRDLVLL